MRNEVLNWVARRIQLSLREQLEPAEEGGGELVTGLERLTGRRIEATVSRLRNRGACLGSSCMEPVEKGYDHRRAQHLLQLEWLGRRRHGHEAHRATRAGNGVLGSSRNGFRRDVKRPHQLPDDGSGQ